MPRHITLPQQTSWGWHTFCALLFGMLCLCATNVQAAPNDLHLHFLYNGRAPGDAEKNRQLTLQRQQWFQNLSTELAFSIAEPVLAPAETLGSAGFDFGVEFSVADIPELKEHWRRAVEDERPDTELFIARLRMRKGIGGSFEVDGTVGFFHNSSAILAGVGLKWALNEGFWYFPDLSIRGAINYMFASRDIDLLTVNVDITLSKQFAILGSFTVTPYAAYSVVYAYSNTQVLDPTPKNFDDNEDSSSGSSNFVLAPEHIFGSRVSFGARFVWYIMSLTFEGSFTVPHFEGPETVGMFNTKISFFF